MGRGDTAEYACVGARAGQPRRDPFSVDEHVFDLPVVIGEAGHHRFDTGHVGIEALSGLGGNYLAGDEITEFREPSLVAQVDVSLVAAA